jgi:TonB family protein
VVRAPRFTLPSNGERDPMLALAVSGSIHIGLLGLFVALALLGAPRIRAVAPVFEELPARLVFLVEPGPGGGGGGGGLKQPKAASRAQRKGDDSLTSPMPDPPPPPPEPVADPKPEPPPPAPAPVEAPVATVKHDPQDQPGVLETPTPAPPEPSNGSGTGGGAGTGEGTGLGRGRGAGVGEGSEAGMGGGPYRPGSGVEPPSLLREVKPDYTEEARRRGVEGEVVMEIIVRRDGTVGEARVLKGLGYGLDQRALEAVRQWRFGAAKRRGEPVDVMVEVSMEFRLR